MNTIKFLTFFVALVGAGAWFPHILKWYKEKRTIAKVIIIPDDQVDIGYTSFGAMFNLNLALATSQKDIIINEIDVYLTHENGEKHRFKWQGLNETISEISNPSGEKVIQSKDQAAIALKLVTTSLVEKFVRFQEFGFPEKFKKIESKLEEYIKYAEKNEQKEEVIKSKEFFDLIEFFKSNFWWKEGKYYIDFKIYCFDKFEFEKLNFEFEIPRYEIEQLYSNIDQIKLLFEHLTTGDLESIKDKLNFYWAKINLNKNNNSV